ncbi:MAG: D-2-hydroxyacid dehydrogenase [Succinivibrio sp.]
MTKKLLIALNLKELEDRHLRMFQKAGDLEITFIPQNEVKALDLEDKNIIVGNVAPDLLKHAGKLEFLQLNSAGFDNYVGKLSKDIPLCTAVGAFSPAVGEHMLAMTFTLIRHFHMYRDKQNSKDWSDLGKITSVEGSCVAVLGLGDIGRSYAKKIKALGASKVIGVRRNLNDKPDYIDELYTLDDYEKYLKDADIVANVLPSSKETVKFFDKKIFSLMKPGAYFINVGRGDAVDQSALIDAVKSGHLAGAALDVTTPEPLPKDSELWDIPEILITPHVAGWFFLNETVERIMRIASDNVRAFLNGGELTNTAEH